MNIDFIGKSKETGTLSSQPVVANQDMGKAVVAAPTSEEQEQFLSTLKALAPKAAVLSATYETDETCASSCQDTSSATPSLPPVISSLFRPHYKTLEKPALIEECQRVFSEELAITPIESHYLMKSTVLQSHSLVWFAHRKGRLTASRFFNICRTSIEKPSKSLIDSVFRNGTTVKTAATTWGYEKEKVALHAYQKQMRKNHASFTVEPSGLMVNPHAPHLGASPDGLVSCTCCVGSGVLEIKCPYSVRDALPITANYFTKINNTYKLKRNHQYYYQIQGQIMIAEASYCDFCCWTNCGINIERIDYDDDFVSEMVPKLDNFFIKVILPKVLCGENTPSVNSEQESEVFCLCKRGQFGKMIFCDSPTCEFGWYHYSCVSLPSNIEFDDNEEWFCPQCLKDKVHCNNYFSFSFSSFCYNLCTIKMLY